MIWKPTRVQESLPVMIPDQKTLERCISGLSFRVRHEFDPDKRERLKIIREEIKALKEAL